jgi:hypothetical protein
MAEAARIEILMPVEGFLVEFLFEMAELPMADRALPLATPQQVQGVAEGAKHGIITGEQMVLGQGDGLEAQMP